MPPYREPPLQPEGLRRITMPEYHDQWPHQLPVETPQPYDLRAMIQPSQDRYDERGSPGPDAPPPSQADVGLASRIETPDEAPGIEYGVGTGPARLNPKEALIRDAIDRIALGDEPLELSMPVVDVPGAGAPDYDACLMTSTLFRERMRAVLAPFTEPGYLVPDPGLFDELVRMVGMASPEEPPP